MDRNLLTPEQHKLAEEAYEEAIREFAAKGQPDGSITRFLFFAGARLGLELASRIYKETIEA